MEFLHARAQASRTVVEPFTFNDVLTPAPAEIEYSPTVRFGEVCDLIVNQGDTLGKISRYETALMKKAEALMKLLNTILAAKNKSAAKPLG